MKEGVPAGRDAQHLPRPRTAGGGFPRWTMGGPTAVEMMEIYMLGVPLCAILGRIRRFGPE